MLDAVKLIQSGYPTRIPYEDIYSKYKGHMPDRVQSLEPAQFCEVIAEARPRLQPHAAQSAAPCGPACNPMCSRCATWARRTTRSASSACYSGWAARQQGQSKAPLRCARAAAHALAQGRPMGHRVGRPPAAWELKRGL